MWFEIKYIIPKLFLIVGICTAFGIGISLCATIIVLTGRALGMQ